MNIITYNCAICQTEVEKTKLQSYYIQKSKNKITTCSCECKSKLISQLQSSKISITCSNCFKSLLRTKSQLQKSKKSFCSSSCSASYNNRNRKVSSETKVKISNKLKNKPRTRKNYKYNCDICKTDYLSSYKKLGNKNCCSKTCQNKLNQQEKQGKSNPKTAYAGKTIDRTKYRFYRTLCEFYFDKKDLPKIKGIELLKKFGMWSVTNKQGVVRDHQYSVKDGFINKVNPEIIKHPANCQFIFQKDNSSKNCKSHITLSQLKNSIKNW